MARRAVSLHVTGIVQGVGFRPFVYNLARRLGVSGWVRNSSEGVFALAEGEDVAVAEFVRAVRDEAPPMAAVDEVVAEDVEPEGLESFEIRESEHVEGAMTLVSPDIATCPACEADLRRPGDRREDYPFVNCTNCGPRFTIIADVPYDRPLTTMRDFPMCAECATEYDDPADRRFHAQPNACPVCGPRLYLNVAGHPQPPPEPSGPDSTGARALATIAAALPPDAEWTPQRESAPRPHRDREAERERTSALLDAAVALLDAGRVLAVKGLGGFQLACYATNEEAVRLLRERKHRWGKPLAIMVRDAEEAAAYCEVGPAEAALLEGTVRPIVLLKRRHGEGPERAEGAARSSADADGAAGRGGGGSAASSAGGERAEGAARSSAGGGGAESRGERDDVPRAPAEDCLSAGPPAAPPALARSLAPGLAEIGVMLPYTPLHHLLLARAGRPLVMTSGNLSDEPIAMENAEALERLAPVADAFLLHDRGIHSRYDDSVARVVEGEVQLVRRARGFAPYPLRMPIASDAHILAVGPEQKNTFALVREDLAFVSQHIGDLENAETLEHFERTIELYERLFRVVPEIVAHDLHPEYLSTKYAMGLDLPKVGVQHHHAHVVSVSAEHGVEEPVVGIAFDGTGYGEDGNIWGGEVLVADWCGYERFAHLRYVPMPGGAGAVRRPARMAVGLLAGLDPALLDHDGARPLLGRLAEGELPTLLTMIERGVNSPLTSSMGRLFDAVAALAGVRDDALYEGQAAIELEAVAAGAAPEADPRYTFGMDAPKASERTGPKPPSLLLDPAPVVLAVLDDVASGVAPATVSRRFHSAVARLIVSSAGTACRTSGIERVALAGGVLMNRLVLSEALHGLEEEGLTALTHLRLPTNDAAIAFGQVVVAASGRRTV